jgi:hypothetical protein
VAYRCPAAELPGTKRPVSSLVWQRSTGEEALEVVAGRGVVPGPVAEAPEVAEVPAPEPPVDAADAERVAGELADVDAARSVDADAAPSSVTEPRKEQAESTTPARRGATTRTRTSLMAQR